MKRLRRERKMEEEEERKREKEENWRESIRRRQGGGRSCYTESLPGRNGELGPVADRSPHPPPPLLPDTVSFCGSPELTPHMVHSPELGQFLPLASNKQNTER